MIKQRPEVAPTRLTVHFTLKELTASTTAQRRGIDNSPPLEVLANIYKLAVGLENVRSLLGKPMQINSGYRCPDLNKIIGGAAKSAHMDGFAADFICPQFGTPLQIVKAIAASEIAFDKCIQERAWVHISFAPQCRRILLTAHFDAGKTTYTAGV